MRNVPIDGGRTYGPPANWDREAQGDCLSLSVLTMLDDGGPIQFTAWELGETELAALQAGGHLWLGDVLPMVHVRRIFVQDAAGDTVGELLGSVLGVREVSLEKHRADHSRALTIAAALRSAIIAAGIELETRVRGGGVVDDWTGADNAGIVERLAAIVRLVRPVSDTVHIPLLNLDDVVRSGRRMPAGFSMSAVAPLDQATRSELERRLGVELNQPGIAPVTAPPGNLSGRNVRSFVDSYEFRADDGDHTPTDAERALIEDALHGFIDAFPLPEDAAAIRNAFSGAMRGEVVNGGAWSLSLHFGRGDGARDRMRAASSLLGSIVTASPNATPTAADVLRYLDTFAGQENTAEEVRDFVQRAARFVDQGKARAEWQADPMLGHFIEWLSE